jgi:hypothetical protein
MMRALPTQPSRVRVVQRVVLSVERSIRDSRVRGGRWFPLTGECWREVDRRAIWLCCCILEIPFHAQPFHTISRRKRNYRPYLSLSLRRARAPWSSVRAQLSPRPISICTSGLMLAQHASPTRRHPKSRPVECRVLSFTSQSLLAGVLVSL